MESRSIKITSHQHPRVNIKIIPGHFATSHSHVNYYIDMTSLKSMHLMAKEAAAELASSFFNTPVDTIVCLDGTEIIGAFLARAIANSGLAGSQGWPPFSSASTGCSRRSRRTPSPPNGRTLPA